MGSFGSDPRHPRGNRARRRRQGVRRAHRRGVASSDAAEAAGREPPALDGVRAGRALRHLHRPHPDAHGRQPRPARSGRDRGASLSSRAPRSRRSSTTTRTRWWRARRPGHAWRPDETFTRTIDESCCRPGHDRVRLLRAHAVGRVRRQPHRRGSRAGSTSPTRLAGHRWRQRTALPRPRRSSTTCSLAGRCPAAQPTSPTTWPGSAPPPGGRSTRTPGCPSSAERVGGVRPRQGSQNSPVGRRPAGTPRAPAPGGDRRVPSGRRASPTSRHRGMRSGT